MAGEKKKTKGETDIIGINRNRSKMKKKKKKKEKTYRESHCSWLFF